MALFEREELQKIRDRGERYAEIEGTSKSWVRAYLALADAANTLDAMIARITVAEVPIEPEKSRKGSK